MHGLFSMSAIDDLSYAPSEEQRVKDDHQNLLVGRRNHKTMKGGREAVWPTYVEGALIDALYRYHERLSTAGKAPGRFPLRNKFISDYIMEATGKYRSAKQVGSRLQQLKFTCRCDNLKELLSHRTTSSDSTSESSYHYHTSPSSFSASSSSSIADCTPRTPPAVPSHASLSDPVGHQCNSTPSLLRTCVSIDILPESTVVPWPSTSGQIFMGLTSMESHSVTEPAVASKREPVESLPLFRNSRVDDKPVDDKPDDVRSGMSGHLPEIDPVVTVSSLAPISVHAHHSFFTVFLDGELVHSETTPLALLSSPPSTTIPEAERLTEGQNRYLYRTSLIPSYWKTLCQSVDPTRYAVVQDIMRDSSIKPGVGSTRLEGAIDAHSVDKEMPDVVVLSVEYRFRHTPSSLLNSTLPSSASSTVDQTLLPPEWPDVPIHHSSLNRDRQSRIDIHDDFTSSQQISTFDYNSFSSGNHSTVPWTADHQRVLTGNVLHGGQLRYSLSANPDIGLPEWPKTYDYQPSAQSSSSCFPSALSNYIL